MKRRILAILLTVALVLALGVTASATTHTVVAGDNLSKLAEQYLGDASRWKEIYEANKDIISDPNSIYVGQQLVIPGNDEAETPVEPEEPTEVPSDVPLKEVTAAPGDADYIQDLYATELYNFKVIINIPNAYDESWDTYISSASGIANMNPDALTKKNVEDLEKIHALRLALVQIQPYADAAWMLWGDDMPTTTPAEDLVFTKDTEDNSDFAPHLVPYLQADQANAKGNIILIAGGGMEQRNNTQEAYPVAEKFVELGYNCFVLQRRVAPYNNTDIYMDMQRSVRCIRYYGEKMGLGGLDMIAAAGFSGGGMTIVGAINNHYGDVLPSDFDADYVPDEIDQVNSDLDVAICVYGIGSLDDTKNTNLPAFLLIAGTDDFLGTVEGNMTMYDKLKDKTIVEMYAFAKNPHGFGAGANGTTSVYWTMLADAYMQQIVEINASQDNGGMFPAQYTKYQTYTVAMPYGEQMVTCAVNDDATEFYMTFTAFGDYQILSGTVTDGIVEVNYDNNGFFTQDAQTLFNGADAEAWQKVPVAIPSKYIKVQEYTVAMPYGDQDVLCAVDADVTEFYMAFTAFGDDQILSGTVTDGIVEVNYDNNGFFTQDAQTLFNGTEGGTWKFFIPYKYTKYQEYTVAMPYGEQKVTCAVNHDGTEFYLVFTAFGEDQVLIGSAIGGSVLVEYDNRGMFTGDAQTLYNGAQSDAWIEIER